MRYHELNWQLADQSREASISGDAPETSPREEHKDLNIEPKVAILLCTYNGQNYLKEQLESYTSQTYKNWQVWASDDNSEDDTQAILKAYQSNWTEGRLSIRSGPGKGFAANFLSLACSGNIDAEYYAFSDQDDIWEADKLDRAVQWLRSIPKNTPALYCSRTRLVDAENNEIGYSPLFSKSPSFRNAITQNIGGGNTMVFNAEARALLQATGDNTQIVSHDWWTYLIVTGSGGKVYYDKIPTLRYRLHGANLVGTNSTWAARLKRLRMLWQGHFRSWNDINIAALKKIEDYLTPENRLILKSFATARQMSIVFRLTNIKRTGIHRQTLMGNIGLAAAAIFKKL